MSAALDWAPDVLGEGFEAATIELADDAEGPVVATLVRGAGGPATAGAVLYVHGFNDYFFQAHVARRFAAAGWAFYALDLRKHGRSLRAHQTPNFCTDLGDYDAELDVAAAAIAADGHGRLLLAAHSTGGLTVPLWAARRPDLPVAGLVLNSPFLALKQPPLLQAALLPVVGAVARMSPTRPLPAGVSSYTESISRHHRGEWEFDLAWKPVGSPVRAGWLAAVARGHARVRAGLGLAAPALVLTSARGSDHRGWHDDLTRTDAVLDPDQIAREAPSISRHTTVVRLDGAVHDVWLSGAEVRARAFEVTDRWLAAWVTPAPPP
ncbi:MAG TPA: alpha/beta hydrolase [Acidimicrobiales bacterium]|nr:alpha/beta hydrolase [Acidimicrobiales bacterium]